MFYFYIQILFIQIHIALLNSQLTRNYSLIIFLTITVFPDVALRK
jgi:hypothetical protein